MSVDILKQKRGKLWRLVYPIVLLLILASTLMTETPAMAATQYVYETSTTADGASFYNWGRMGQTFTVTSAHTVDAVSILGLSDPGAQGTLTVDIYKTINGMPAGTPLISGTMNVADMPTSTQWIKVPMNDNYPLMIGTMYAISVSKNYTPDQKMIAWLRSNGDSYSGGQALYGYETSWSSYQGDFTFIIYGEQTAAINEFVIDHAGDDTHEFVEIYGQPSTDYSNMTVIQIDGNGPNAGIVNHVKQLGTTNSNGIWWTDYLPQDTLVKGTSSLLLVQGFTGTVGQDLDVAALAL